MFDWRKRFDELGVQPSGEQGYLPATMEELEALKLRAGATSLPATFVEIATTLGNAWFRKSVSVLLPRGESWGVWRFHGGEEDDGGFLSYHETFCENTGYPVHLIPFASDLSSQTYAFDARTARGAVYFDLSEPEPVFVAPSFDEFLSLMTGRD